MAGRGFVGEERYREPRMVPIEKLKPVEREKGESVTDHFSRFLSRNRIENVLLRRGGVYLPAYRYGKSVHRDTAIMLARKFIELHKLGVVESLRPTSLRRQRIVHPLIQFHGTSYMNFPE